MKRKEYEQKKLRRIQPWVVDQALVTAAFEHLQLIKSDVPFDWPRYPPAISD